MNEMQTAAPRTEPVPREESDFLDFLMVFARHKRKIFLFPFLLAVVIAGLSLTMDNIFKATTKLMPPQQSQSGAAALLSSLGGAAGAVAGMAGIKDSNDMYVGMLKSRTIGDRIIARFKLQELYDKETMEKTRKQLEENTMVTSGKDGMISIVVLDKDPKRVAEMANAYVEELTRLNKVLAVTEASKRRLFFERQLEGAKDDLAASEMKLKGGLETNGVISVDADSRVIMETVGRVRAQIAAKEIELNSMRAFVTDNNQEYKVAREQLSSLRTELSRLQNGRPDMNPTKDTSSQPGLENIKLLRDVKYNQMLYELLARQYEVARIDEAKDASVIQVLDVAIVPEKKFKPMRSIIVLVPTLLAFFLMVLVAFLIEAKRKFLSRPEAQHRWDALRSEVKRK